MALQAQWSRAAYRVVLSDGSSYQVRYIRSTMRYKVTLEGRVVQKGDLVEGFRPNVRAAENLVIEIATARAA